MSDERVVAPSLSELRTHHSEKWRGFSSEVLPLPVAEMDYPIADPIKKLLHQMVDQSDTGYLGPIPEMGVNFAKFAQNRWGWKVDPLQVHIGTDVGVAVVELLRIFTVPGDAILISSPVYQNFHTWINETKITAVDVPFVQTTKESTVDVNPWEIDWAGIEKAYTTGIKVHLLCSPHNPLGFVYTEEDLKKIADLAAKHKVIVISDEIHAPLTFKEKKFVPFLAVSENARKYGICVTAASKGWNIAGLKCAIIVTDGDEMNEKMKELPYALHFRASLFGAFASALAFAEGEPWLDTVMNNLDENRFLIKNLLDAQLPSVGYHLPHNGYLAWLDLAALNLGEDPSVKLLEVGKVAFNPGRIYSPFSSQYVRLNFATSPAIISEAIDRIAASI